ncbi:MAG: hypothetical protein KDD53_09640 [Bdellovibrionales bacterium]|nr:hypothetical protein [Bdellovibrionales bacterium]
MKKEIKNQILQALRHPEASDGLYLRNFSMLHEEDERPGVEADEAEILEALNDLVKEGKVSLQQLGEEVVFFAA